MATGKPMASKAKVAASQPATTEPVPWWRDPHLYVAAAGLFLSIALAFASFATWLDGSRIVVDQPHTAIFYRDGKGDGAALKIALQLSIANTAGESYGDALTDASLSIRGMPDVWQVESIGIQAIDSDGFEAERTCPIGSTCIRHGKFYSVEQYFQIVPVRGGDARTVNLIFAIVPRCSDAACVANSGFARAVPRWLRTELILDLALRFQSDGERRKSCVIRRLRPDYLLKTGYSSRRCEQGVAG